MGHSQEFLFTYTIVTLSSIELTTQDGNRASLLQQGRTNPGTTCICNQLKGLDDSQA